MKNPAVDASIADLFEMPKSGAGIGLHRMMDLCADLLATPWMTGLDAMKVTGSNGKGSVCAMLGSMLRELDLSTGVYTSPHLLRFNERISIEGHPISSAELEAAVTWFRGRRRDYESRHPGDTIGAFEAFTAVALSAFAARQPEALVVEAGIGGRYDPTRIIPGAVVALTSVDLEHTALLGGSLELIAYDKADLCPHGGVLVTGRLEGDLLRRLRAYARLRDLSVRSTLEFGASGPVSFGESHMTLDLEVDGLRFADLRVGLQGHHQIDNAMIAIFMLREWLTRRRPELPIERFERAVRAGLASVSWPGRFQRIHQEPDVFIDVGHSPDAISRMLETAAAALAGRRILLVIGVSHDKAVLPIVSQLVRVADAVVATRAHHKGSPVAQIEQLVKTLRPDIPCMAEEAIEDAMVRSLSYAKSHGMTVLVAGGLFLSIEAMQALSGDDPRQLRFF